MIEPSRKHVLRRPFVMRAGLFSERTKHQAPTNQQGSSGASNPNEFMSTNQGPQGRAKIGSERNKKKHQGLPIPRVWHANEHAGQYHGKKYPEPHLCPLAAPGTQ